MLSARIHEYKKPLELEDVQMPSITSGEEVIVRVAATGLCHSDLYIINGDLKDIIPLNLPSTPGHEIAGWVQEVGNKVPESIVTPGDMVAVFAGWSCGICKYCKNRDEQLCSIPRWPGVISNGGFSEFMIVPSYRFLVKVEKGVQIKPEELAPLADAGVTPYRAIKKVKNSLGLEDSIGIIGIGGLGSYAIQYAKMLSCESRIVAFGRNESKLELAAEFGADATINIEHKKKEDVRDEINNVTNGKGLNVVLDCVGLENTADLGISLLA